MNTFENLNLSKQLGYAIADLGFDRPTPIQSEAFSVIRSGKNIVGISQTGTGKTLAYMLPILQDLKFSKQVNPRVLILVPTRELVLQVVEQIETFAKYISIRVIGVYGGTNINTQKKAVSKGCDILVATPGRLYDLTLSGALKLKAINKLVVDEVDVMLDLGFRFQLTNIFELLPESRQNIMFSATMTEDIDVLIEDFFIAPAKISIAVSGTPLDNIAQQCYPVPNFYTKVNLLSYLLKDKTEYSKVLVFAPSKKNADRIFEALEPSYGSEMGVIHSNKSQNYRIRSIEQFDNGTNRILIATDVMARGLDLEQITHVINIDTPSFPENYMHRIGRTGRAEKEGKSILFYTEKEVAAKEAIETLMAYQIPVVEFPPEVEVSTELIPEERTDNYKHKNHNRNDGKSTAGPSFHEKKDKNKKVNLGGKYRRELAKKYKKAKTRGDKIQNNRKKKRK
ncbi:MAG: DEAD/DEAH box helicase [Saprospiraceae bacterium]|nr:MAG: DEAD/DEAH box helicase [Saprospiraceae bacterium]